MNEASAEDHSAKKSDPLLVIRSVVGGILMGLANLVPGISGGTMLLASGIYPKFIDAIADITTFKFRRQSIIVLGSVVSAAFIGILLLAGTIKGLVLDYRWIMYSIFIGLTLGGVPVVWGMIRRPSTSVWSGAFVGFLAMAGLAWAQSLGLGTSGSGAAGMAMLFLAGLAGASAMILPGVSGGYLLLVLGQYVPILTAIDDLKTGLEETDFGAIVSIGLKVLVPVGLGVVIGVVAVSNLLKILLHRFEKATLGVLLGLLLGAVVGLWPFQEGVKPAVGDEIKGQVLTEETLGDVEPEDYPTRFFRPTAGQGGMALGLIVLGFAGTAAIAKLGGSKPEEGLTG